MVTRREFLKLGAAAGAGLALNWSSAASSAFAINLPPRALTPEMLGVNSPNLTRWIDPLPVLGGGIPVATPIPNNTYAGADYYEIEMKNSTWKFHSELGAAPTWGYWAGSAGIGYLGPAIVAQSGKSVVVKFTNNLSFHPLAASIDRTLHSMLMDPDDPDNTETLTPDTRAAVHLHGGFTKPQFDGHPDSWFADNGTHGMKYATLPGAQGNQAILEYSNRQPACMLWYHDHAMGITRLNAYAGLAAAYVIRDNVDTGVTGQGLNIPKLPYEVPLVLQDKIFNPDGSMFYPTTNGLPYPTYPHDIWTPEFFGDTPVVNGKAYPFLEVEPRRYRLRFLNGSQARFYGLSIENTKKNVRYPFWIIGMEQSLLPAPVQLNTLLLSPAERGDVIFDFAQVPFGTTLTLLNSAKAPYPGGRGGAITQIMQFRVTKPLSSPDTTAPPAQLVLPAVPRLAPDAPMREIVMKETEDEETGVPEHVKLNEWWFSDPVTENPKVNTTEIWQFINLTVDAHPMHMHLVKFQVYDRQPFDAKAYDDAWSAWVAAGRNSATQPVLANYFTGAPRPPAPEEMGWKDTFKVYPGQIGRVIATFEVPPGTTLPAEYVYHCHILEHEENEMMRPFQVVS